MQKLFTRLYDWLKTNYPQGIEGLNTKDHKARLLYQTTRLHQPKDYLH